MKIHLQESRTSTFSGGTCPRTPLGLNALRAFGKYARLLLLSTHLRKNLLKPLTVDIIGVTCCSRHHPYLSKAALLLLMKSTGVFSSPFPNLTMVIPIK